MQCKGLAHDIKLILTIARTSTALKSPFLFSNSVITWSVCSQILRMSSSGLSLYPCLMCSKRLLLLWAQPEEHELKIRPGVLHTYCFTVDVKKKSERNRVTVPMEDAILLQCTLKWPNTKRLSALRSVQNPLIHTHSITQFTSSTRFEPRPHFKGFTTRTDYKTFSDVSR